MGLKLSLCNMSGDFLINPRETTLKSFHRVAGSPTPFIFYHILSLSAENSLVTSMFRTPWGGGVTIIYTS